MKILIAGAGSLGTLMAGLLARGGNNEVWLLSNRPEDAQTINSRGISVDGVAGTWQAKVRGCTDAKDAQGCALAVVCVKAYDTKAASRAIRPAVGDETFVLTLQNGMGNVEILNDTLGAERIIGGVTSMGAALTEPGRVRYTGKGETVIGRIDGKLPVVMRSVRETFNRAGIETKAARDIRGFLWSKLLINAGINALSAVTRLPNGKLAEIEETRGLMRQAVSEGAKLAKRKRIKLIYDDPLAKAEAVCEATAANHSSMLQDVLRKKRTEIEYINGFIVRQGQELGIPVPVNTVLRDLVKTIEQNYDVQVK